MVSWISTQDGIKALQRLGSSPLFRVNPAKIADRIQIIGTQSYGLVQKLFTLPKPAEFTRLDEPTKIERLDIIRTARENSHQMLKRLLMPTDTILNSCKARNRTRMLGMAREKRLGYGECPPRFSQTLLQLRQCLC